MLLRPYLSAVCLLLLLGLSGIGLAEYYEYVDENGVRIFTDDRSMVPSGSSRSKIHKERFDHLDEEEKQRRIEVENQAIERMNQETEQRLREYQLKDAAEQKEQEEMARQKRRLALRTPVAIVRNMILVPVTFTYRSREVTATMLLDTGASITSVNEAVIAPLNIEEGKSSAVVVAGGGILKTRLVTVDEIQVGPRAMADKQIMVYPKKGPDLGYQGLLGQDFLRYFSFSVDYTSSIIQWDE